MPAKKASSKTQKEPQKAAKPATGKAAGEAAMLRGLLLSTAEALALGGILPKAAVDKIKRGRGPIDQARDCVELAALYRKRHRDLRRAGFWLWPDDVDAHVPALQSQKPVPAKKAPASPPIEPK